MQVEQEQLMRQQTILKALGFYHGKIDGIWGPRSIEAKKKFEADTSFRPGIPNNGMPFGSRPPYPAGITVDVASGLLYHPMIKVEPETNIETPASETVTKSGKAIKEKESEEKSAE